MADYRRLHAFREIVALVDAEFIERGIPLKPGAAVDMVAERAELIAERYGIMPRSALKYGASVCRSVVQRRVGSATWDDGT